jgi:hypothetical protein
MKVKNLNIITITALVFLLVIGVFSTPVSAAVAWSDDFSDGNYDGWTILEGAFDTPVSPKYSLTCSAGLGMIYYPSTQFNGNWLFELYEDGNVGSDIEVFFMATGTTLEDFEGYTIYLKYNPSEYYVALMRWNYSSIFEVSAKWTLAHDEIWNDADPLPDPGWHTYNVTRIASGNMTISRDDEIIIETNPVQHEWDFDAINNNCDKFVVKAEEYASIDTIVVGTDLPPITTETTSTTSTTTSTTNSTTSTTNGTQPYLTSLLPIIGIASAAVIVVVVVLFLKNR